MAETISIREARVEDLEAIERIYNEAILHTTATFDLELRTKEQTQTWFAEHQGKWSVLVAEELGQIVGWASLSEWSGRCAYAETAENSVYIDAAARGKGIGKKLLAALLELASGNGFHTIVARVADRNPASVALHLHFGFQEIGVMKEVGKKFDRRIDVTLFQKMI